MIARSGAVALVRPPRCFHSPRRAGGRSRGRRLQDGRSLRPMRLARWHRALCRRAIELDVLDCAMQSKPGRTCAMNLPRSRRSFLVASSLTGTGLLVGCRKDEAPRQSTSQPSQASAVTEHDGAHNDEPEVTAVEDL